MRNILGVLTAVGKLSTLYRVEHSVDMYQSLLASAAAI